MSDNLTGSHWVRVLLPAVHDAQRLWPRTSDRMIVRRHALKLRYWPAIHPTDDHGQVLDLDWSWIQALKGSNVGELRIHDVIGGHDNIRLIFYRHPERRAADPLPVIWVLAAMQKKRDEFTAANIATFRARRQLVLTRFYGA